MVFVYIAIATDGERCSGRVEAETREEALGRIKEMGRQPVRVEATQAEAPAQAPVARSRRITSAAIAQFMRQFADLVLAGLTLDRCLTILAEQIDNTRMRALIEEVQVDVRGGSALSQALERHPRYFPPMVVNMLRAGEMSGQL